MTTPLMYRSSYLDPFLLFTDEGGNLYDTEDEEEEEPEDDVETETEDRVPSHGRRKRSLMIL